MGYLLAPVSYIAVRKLIQVDFRTYLWQFMPSLFASFAMVAVITGLRHIFGGQSLNVYLKLAIYLLAGVLTYGLVIVLTARQLYQEVLNLVSLVVPKWKFRKI